MTTFLSIDWDFFPFNGLYSSEFIDVRLPDGTTRSAPLANLFDWGAVEGGQAGAYFATDAWQSRVFAWAINGLSIERVACIDRCRGSVRPTDFVAELRSRFELCESVAVAESHLFALEYLNAYADRYGPLDVVHFDAHHDLGYSQDAAREEPNCGNWLLHALDRNLAGTVTVVYPDWQGLAEFTGPDAEDPLRWPQLEPFVDRITWCTWSEWRDRTPASIASPEPVPTFLCRSPAWSPPWHDDDFAEFASDLGVPMPLETLYERSWEPASLGEDFFVELRKLDEQVQGGDRPSQTPVKMVD